MSQPPTTKIVRCCHCRGMMRVAARALSVFCPHCQKRATLESLRLLGSHPGKQLATCGDILVETASQLNLEITANNVVVRGRVQGSITANECVEVASTGRVIGDVTAHKIIVRDGGVIQGLCRMTRNEQPAGPSKDRQEQVGFRSQSVDRDSLAGGQSVPHRDESGPTAPKRVEPNPRQIRSIRLD